MKCADETFWKLQEWSLECYRVGFFIDRRPSSHRNCCFSSHFLFSRFPHSLNVAQNQNSQSSVCTRTTALLPLCNVRFHPPTPHPQHFLDHPEVHLKVKASSVSSTSCASRFLAVLVLMISKTAISKIPELSRIWPDVSLLRPFPCFGSNLCVFFKTYVMAKLLNKLCCCTKY